MARAAWYKLDNIGKFYSAQAGSNAQTVFRVSAEMKDEIDPDLLQQALDATIQTFPGFNVALRSGLFWHYLVQLSEPPRVELETLPVCFPLHFSQASVLMRVNYFDRRINLEVSHIISDGRGTLEFFKALIGSYASIRYGVSDAVEVYRGTEAEKTEDSYAKNYERRESAGADGVKAYRLTGWKNAADPTFMEYHLAADEVLAKARAMNVSLTSLLIAAVICAIRKEMPTTERDKAINIDVPVDLRRFFGSSTMRNFFGLAFVEYTPHDLDEPLEEIAHQVQAELSTRTEPHAIKQRMNRMIKLEKNPVLRVAPLFLKDLVLGIAARIANRNVTTTFSSIGKITLPDSLSPYVKGISVLTTTSGLNFVACTYGNDLSIGVTTIFTRHSVVRQFVQELSDLGLHGYMNINKDAAGIDADLKQAQFEDRLLKASENLLSDRTSDKKSPHDKGSMGTEERPSA